MSDALADEIARAVAKALRDELPAAVHDLADLGAQLSGPHAYSIPGVARRLDISERQVYRLIDAGLLVPVPHLNPTRIAERTIEAFLAGDGLAAVR